LPTVHHEIIKYHYQPKAFNSISIVYEAAYRLMLQSTGKKMPLKPSSFEEC
jgi:hypothetical protein